MLAGTWPDAKASRCSGGWYSDLGWAAVSARAACARAMQCERHTRAIVPCGKMLHVRLLAEVHMGCAWAWAWHVLYLVLQLPESRLRLSWLSVFPVGVT